MDGFDGAKPAVQAAQRVGRIVSVLGCQAVFVLERDAQGMVSPMQIGALVKVMVGQTIVYGVVSGLSIPVPSTEPGAAEMRVVELTLIGEVMPVAPGRPGLFRRGVSFFPSLGDAVFAAAREDFIQVYAPPAAANISIGTLHHDRSIQAHGLTDELLGKHFAVLGTTGSGKSCAAAVILRGLVAQNPNAHIVVLDPHGEYARAFGGRAEVIGSENLELPHWLLNFEELLQILFGPNTDPSSPEAEIMLDLVVGAKHDYVGGAHTDQPFSADQPVPYRLSDLMTRLANAMGKLDNTANLAPYRRIKQRMIALQSDARYAFMFGGVSVRDRMAAILGHLFRIPGEGKPVTILDLSGMPSELMPVIVAMVCRLAFSFGVWSGRAVPLLLVCEEAHRYAPQVAEPGFEITKNWLTRIAKEGRKYGVSLCVISQRPSKLAADLISQCNTIFCLRLSNNEDQQFLRGATSDGSIGLFEFLPTLLTGEAIAVGQGVTLPIRMRFHPLPEAERPGAGVGLVSQAWKQPVTNPGFLPAVVARWRLQRRERSAA
jgi:uncharacterized protein